MPTACRIDTPVWSHQGSSRPAGHRSVAVRLEVDSDPQRFRNEQDKSKPTTAKMRIESSPNVTNRSARLPRCVIALFVSAVSCSLPIVCSGQTSTDPSAKGGSVDERDFTVLQADTEKFFRARVTPFIKTYC